MVASASSRAASRASSSIARTSRRRRCSPRRGSKGLVAPRRPRCCGALFLHTGYEEEALSLGRETIAAFEDCDTVVVNAAGCGSSLRDLGHLLADDPQWAERAAAFSAKVHDVSAFLAAVEPRAPRRRSLDLRVAYHDACHLAHAQGVRSEPRALLAALPGLELVEPPEWEVCCGSAGLYNLLQPEAAAALGRRKARNLAKTGADAIAAGNPGCALQIGTYLEEEGRSATHRPSGRARPRAEAP